MAEKLILLASNIAIKGGTNRAMFDLIHGLCNDFDITILAFESATSAYPIPSNARLVAFPRADAVPASRVTRTLNSLAIVSKVAQVIRVERPRTVLSFTPRPNIVNVLAKRWARADYRCVISERNFNSIQYGADWQGRAFIQLMRATYPCADAIVANASDLAVDLERSFGVPKEKLCVVHNPFDVQKIAERAGMPVDHPWFHDGVPIVLNVARLIPQKNQRLLFDAFARVRKEMLCRLVLVGEGKLRDVLERAATELGIANDVLFVGWDDNPFRFMSRSAVFVLSSNFEGLPSVIIEAMASGCAVVSTDCPSGPREILGDGKFGLLAPVGDADALAQQIRLVLSDVTLRQYLIEVGRVRANDFETSKIVAQLKEIL